MNDKDASAPDETKIREAAARRASLARWTRRIVSALVVAALGAVFVVALLPQPVPVDVTEVDRGPIVVTVEEPGRTRVMDRYVVSAPLAGNLARVELRPSQTVEEGQIVARVVPLAPPLLDARTRSEAEVRLASARARRDQARFAIGQARDLLAFAERTAARQRQLAARSVTSPVELERAEVEERTRRNDVASMQFALRVAEHDVRVAEAALGRLGAGASADPESVDVSSPVGGVVLRVLRESAGVVAPGEPILEVGDAAALEIVTDVLTSDAVRMRPNARVTIDGWGGDALEGRVRLVEPSAVTRTSALGVSEQRVDVIIDLVTERERWAALGDGYRVETHIVIDERAEALRVPGSAVFRSGDGWAAYVVEGGVARLRRLELGLRSRDVVEVLGGLAEGARVVVYPGERVTDGAEVSVRP